MDPEDKQLLQSTYKLVEENNKLLHKVRGVQNRAALFQILKWIIIIGVTFGAFYFLQPYVNKLMNLYDSLSGTQQELNNPKTKDFLKKL